MNASKLFLLTSLSASIASLVIVSPAIANVTTSDSQAWDNDTTLEVGFRSFDKPTYVTKYRHEDRQREVHVPEVLSPCGNFVVEPAHSYHETYQVEVPYHALVNKNFQTANGKISQKFGSDFIAGLGIDNKAYGFAAVKNGNLVLSGDINTHGQAGFNAAYTVTKGVSVVYRNASHVNAAGVQFQLGGASLLAAANLSGGGYSFGFGQETALSSKQPTFNLQPVREVKLVTPKGTILVKPKTLPLPVVKKPVTLPRPCGDKQIKIKLSDSFKCISTEFIKGRG